MARAAFGERGILPLLLLALGASGGDRAQAAFDYARHAIGMPSAEFQRQALAISQRTTSGR
jgi:hypothetical protein